MTDQEDIKVIKRWFSIGDILTIAIMIATVAMSYGSLSSRLDNLNEEFQELQSRDITPGARTEIAALQAKDVSQDAAIQELREQLREQRREILESLYRLENQLQSHDKK